MKIIFKIMGVCATIVAELFILFISFIISIPFDNKCGLFDFYGTSNITHTPCLEAGASFWGGITIVVINIAVLAFLVFQIISLIMCIWNFVKKKFKDDKSFI